MITMGLVVVVAPLCVCNFLNVDLNVDIYIYGVSTSTLFVCLPQCFLSITKKEKI